MAASKADAQVADLAARFASERNAPLLAEGAPAQPPAAFMAPVSTAPAAMTAAPSKKGLYPRECPRVARFMESIGAGWLRERFAEEDIDGDLLATMNYSDLLDMDVPDGACRAIAQALQNTGL